MWRACNLNAFIHSSTGPVVHPLASCHEGPRFNPLGGTYVKLGFSCLRCLATLMTPMWLIIVALSELRTEPPIGRRADNVIIPLDLTRLFSPRFHVRCRSSFRLHNRHSQLLGGGALWRACNLTALIHSSTGPVVHLFASRHEGPRFNPLGGTYVKPRFSC